MKTCRENNVYLKLHCFFTYLAANSLYIHSFGRDSSFFTINGYSMLLDGGFDRVQPCLSNFVSMLQQIDSVLITHSAGDVLDGLRLFFAKKLADPEAKPMVLTVLLSKLGLLTWLTFEKKDLFHETKIKKIFRKKD